MRNPLTHLPAANGTIHLGLLGMAALWGASWPWGRVVAQAMPPLAAACLRFALAGLVLVLWLARSGRADTLRTLGPRQWLGLAAASAVGVLGYSVCFLLALQRVPAGQAAMVVALNPVLTLLLAAGLFGEALSWARGLGVLLAVAGAWHALSAHGGGGLAAGAPQPAGLALLLGCAACWVGYTLLGRRMLATVDALGTTTATTSLGALMLGSASLAIEGPAAWLRLAAAPGSAWLSLIALALGATTLAYAWYLQGVKRLGAGAAAAYLALVPLFGLLFSHLGLHEPLNPALLGGGGLAVLGMLLIQRRPATVTVARAGA